MLRHQNKWCNGLKPVVPTYPVTSSPDRTIDALRDQVDAYKEVGDLIGDLKDAEKRVDDSHGQWTHLVQKVLKDRGQPAVININQSVTKTDQQKKIGEKGGEYLNLNVSYFA